MQRTTGVRTSLADDILAAYERALLEQDIEVAGVLLGALEVLGESQPLHRRKLERAYLMIAERDRCASTFSPSSRCR